MFEKDRLYAMSPYSHSPRNIIPNLIIKDSLILDVGCNTGYLGKKLKEKNVVSDGIDINDKALLIAAKYYRNVFKRDLYNPVLNLPKCQYNYIVFSDILEHLPRPDLILLDAKKYLKRNGKIIVSIPNIARFEIRLKLLFGNFDYKDGILGPDHLRFFTRRSAVEMLEKCGYKVEKILPTGLGHRVKVFLTLTAFQFIYIARKIK